MPTVNLLGPNPPQSMDYQTQQAQLAIAQQIAQSMVGQGLSPDGSPIVRTAAGNPFGRDVANVSGPIVKALMGIMGQRQLGDINTKQQDLAGLINQRYQTDIGKVMGNFMPHPETMLGDQGGPGDALANPTPDVTRMVPGGGMSGAVRDAAGSLDPRVQAIAATLLKGQTELESKMAMTPEAMAQLVGRGGVDPTSVPSMTSPGTFSGAPVLSRPQNAVLMPKVEKYGPGETVVAPVLGGPTATGPAAPPVLAKGEDQASVQVRKDVGKGKIEELEAGKNRAQSVAKGLPAVATLYNLVDQSQTGWGAPQIVAVRQALKQLGVSDDAAGKVVNTQTMIKYALPEATSEGRGLSSRITQMEFSKFLETYGADPTADDRTLKNIFRKSLINGMNDVEMHNYNIGKAGQLGQIGKDQAESYRVPLPGPDEIFSNLKGPVKFKQDKTTGVWSDELVGSPEANTSAPKIESRPLPAGGTAYKGSNGKWYTSEAEARSH